MLWKVEVIDQEKVIPWLPNPDIDISVAHYEKTDSIIGIRDDAEKNREINQESILFRSKCDHEVNSKSIMKEHLHDDHGRDIFQCKVRDYKATLESNLRVHIVEVHEVNNYSGEQCSYNTDKEEKVVAPIQENHDLANLCS